MVRNLRAKPAQLLLRLTEELKDKLTAAAHANDRTVTSEVNERLVRSFENISNTPADFSHKLDLLMKVSQEDGAAAGEFRLNLTEELMALKQSVIQIWKETSDIRREWVDIRRELSDIRRSEK